MANSSGQEPRILPRASSLEEAVTCVIQSNTADQYVPNRFIPMVKGKTGRELQRVCKQLITSGTTLEHIDKAFVRHPQLLTIEDYVSRFGADWGLSMETIEVARARVTYFDQLAHGQRYV